MDQQRPALPDARNASLVRGLPAWTYFNAELTALEYETLIRPSWQFVCHVNQLKEPGSFATLDMMRDSIIVMRGKDFRYQIPFGTFLAFAAITYVLYGEKIISKWEVLGPLRAY